MNTDVRETKNTTESMDGRWLSHLLTIPIAFYQLYSPSFSINHINNWAVDVAVGYRWRLFPAASRMTWLEKGSCLVTEIHAVGWGVRTMQYLRSVIVYPRRSYKRVIFAVCNYITISTITQRRALMICMYSCYPHYWIRSRLHFCCNEHTVMTLIKSTYRFQCIGALT